MTPNPGQKSATIYRFPVGGRAGLSARTIDQTANEIKLPKGSEFALADAWYHQEAIRDARLARKP